MGTAETGGVPNCCEGGGGDCRAEVGAIERELHACHSHVVVRGGGDRNSAADCCVGLWRSY